MCMWYSLSTLSSADTVLVIELFVTKNKVIATDLQLVKKVKLRKNTNLKQFLRHHLTLQRYVQLFQGNLVRQQVFVIQNVSISGTIYRNNKNILRYPRFY